MSGASSGTALANVRLAAASAMEQSPSFQNAAAAGGIPINQLATAYADIMGPNPVTPPSPSAPSAASSAPAAQAPATVAAPVAPEAVTNAPAAVGKAKAGASSPTSAAAPGRAPVPPALSTQYQNAANLTLLGGSA